MSPYMYTFTSRIGVETSLWLILALATYTFADKHIHQSACLAVSSVFGFSLVLASQYMDMYPNPRIISVPEKSIWRIAVHVPTESGNNINTYHESQGLLMSFILIPLLLNLMSFHDHHWQLYARVAFPIQDHLSFFLVNVVLLVTSDEFVFRIKAYLFLGSWFIIFHSLKHFKSMHFVWTIGEWCIVSCITAIVFTEMLFFQVDISTSNDYYLVAALGSLGALLGCCIAASQMLTHTSTTYKSLVLLSVPSVFLQTGFAILGLDKPTPLHWILNFLAQAENGVPRYHWLGYWSIVLSVTLPLASCNSFTTRIPIVVARKWFHLVAILLFAPTTIMAPQLMTLAYAVALALLMILECARSQLPSWLQALYCQFVDDDKESADRVIISHVALIAGCAIPLWLSECTKSSTNSELKLWGVVVLGVGDAAAAIVGRTMGRIRWGRKRTLEGSVAMACSMTLFSPRFGRGRWISAVIFTTLVEAFTSQIDNVVLPLVGAVILLVP